MPHRVTLTTGFWMLETQVTQAMWQGVMNESIDQKAQQRKSGHALAGVGANYPMYYVSWNDCQDFCRTLSDKIGLMVSLPTEAQWEYACRAGTTGPYAGDLEAMGWYVENANETSHPVAQKQPNAWGLYDMHGNLWEWCQDCWHKNHTTSSVTDPMEPILNSYRVYRGGSWYNHAISCRSARRGHFLAGYRNYRLGFRVIVIGT